MNKVKASIPNTITCLNLISGAVACIFSFSSMMLSGGLMGYQWAFIFIALASVFDFSDGASARLLHAYSPVGKELDSLADLVSFGLAPSLLLYNTITFYEGCEETVCWVAIPSLFIAAMGALRLAKFNVDDRQTVEFIGLPIPANAIFWIGFIAWIHSHVYVGKWIIWALILALGLLMVCNMRMFSLKFKNFALAENFRRYVLILGAAVFVLFDGVSGLAWTIVLYLALSALPRREA